MYVVLVKICKLNANTCAKCDMKRECQTTVCALKEWCGNFLKHEGFDAIQICEDSGRNGHID